MHQHEELDSPKLAAYFVKKINKEWGTDIPEPQFVNEAYGQMKIF
jgi:hypothetical protein